jgi:hypothetical protein
VQSCRDISRLTNFILFIADGYAHAPVPCPLLEQYIIPSTWRELGIGWYGTFNRLQLSGAIMNGLNSAFMEHGTGLKDARNEGAFATANNIAVTASAVYNLSPCAFRYLATRVVR